MSKTIDSVSYHWAYSHTRHRISPHSLDFNHYPLPFKSFIDPSCISLKREKNRLRDAGSLADLLFFAYGVTHARNAGGIPYYKRTVPSAGGLYPCHIYIGIESDVGNGSDKVETGLYYYDPVRTCLVQLRTGEKPMPENGFDLAAGTYRALFIITASFYNSAWKYRGRGYRYMLLDAGHLVRNLELVLDAQGMPGRVDYDFKDPAVGDLLNLDMMAEVPLACVSTGWDKSVSAVLAQMAKNTQPDFPKSDFRPAEKSYMTAYGVLPGIHTSGIPVQQPKAYDLLKIAERLPVETLDIGLSNESDKSEKIEDVPGNTLLPLLITRRSRRNFVQAPVSWDAFQTLVEWLRSGLVADNRGTGDGALHTGMICQNIEGLVDGFYLFDRAFVRLDLMDKGQLAPTLAGVCLDQVWISRAAITFLFFSDLKALENNLGPRGYRYMMMHAGRLGQQIYLGAESLGFGCCGIGAIYDGDAARLFELTRESALVYAVSAGPVKKRIGL